MGVHLIYARARNGVIGHQGQLPWHLPEDLAHFKRTTQGNAVLMGRKTWDSLPERFRPLPGRTNMVMTRQSNWSESGALVVHSIEEAQVLAGSDKPLWVIGGAQLYTLALPLAQEVVVTEIDADFAGDTHLPALDAKWMVASQTAHQSESGLSYRFIQFKPKE